MSVWPHHFQHRQIHDCGFTTQSFEENGMCFSNRPVIQQHKRSFVCSGHEGKRYCCKCKEQTNQQRHLSQHVNEAEAVFTNHSVTISTATWIEAFSSPHGPLSLLLLASIATACNLQLATYCNNDCYCNNSTGLLDVP